MERMLGCLLFIVAISSSFAQTCPTEAERDETLERLNEIQFFDDSIPVGFADVPRFIVALSEFFNDNSSMAVSASGVWPTTAIIAEYSLIWKPFLNIMRLDKFNWVNAYTWMDTDVVTRSGLVTAERLGAPPNTIWTFPVTLTWHFEECGSIVNFLDFVFTDVAAYALGYFDGHPVADINQFCYFVTGFGGEAGYCGTTDNVQPAVFPASDDTTEYTDFASCVAFMSSKPLTCNTLEDMWKGDTILCRQLHQIFLPVDPGVHCNHVGMGSDFCKPEDCTDYPAPQCSIITEAIGAYDCQDPVCKWDAPEVDWHLSGFACGSTSYYTLEDAQQMCCLCPSCHGVVEKGGIFTTRAGNSLQPSDSGEIAHRMTDDPRTCDFGTVEPGKYLADAACDDDEVYHSVEDAKDACCDCTSCRGVTCDPQDMCTIRSGEETEVSGSSERSYQVTSEPSCLTLRGDLANNAFSPTSNVRGSAEVIIDPSLEFFDITIEWANATGHIKGIHIHEPKFYLKAVFLCVDDMTSPCIQRVHRGDQAGFLTWESLISQLINDQGLFVLLHTVLYPATEGIAYLRCEGATTPPFQALCSPADHCPGELYFCFQDDQCIAWLTLYALDVCHYDQDRVLANTTPPEECWALTLFDPTTVSFQYSLALFGCLVSLCGV